MGHGRQDPHRRGRRTRHCARRATRPGLCDASCSRGLGFSIDAGLLRATCTRGGPASTRLRRAIAGRRGAAVLPCRAALDQLQLRPRTSAPRSPSLLVSRAMLPEFRPAGWQAGGFSFPPCNAARRKGANHLPSSLIFSPAFSNASPVFSTPFLTPSETAWAPSLTASLVVS